MKKRGALYEKAKLPFVSYAVVDGNLVTGHNPRTRQGNGLEGGPLSCVSRRPRCCGYPPPVDSGLLGVRLEQDIDGREREDHERAHLLGGAHVADPGGDDDVELDGQCRRQGHDEEQDEPHRGVGEVGMTPARRGRSGRGHESHRTDLDGENGRERGDRFAQEDL